MKFLIGIGYISSLICQCGWGVQDFPAGLMFGRVTVTVSQPIPIPISGKPSLSSYSREMQLSSPEISENEGEGMFSMSPLDAGTEADDEGNSGAEASSADESDQGGLKNLLTSLEEMNPYGEDRESPWGGKVPSFTLNVKNE